MARTIYRVGGDEPAGPGPEATPLALGPLTPGATFGLDDHDGDPARSVGGLKGRKFFWVLVGIAALVIVMIVAIAVLGATENLEVGADSAVVSALAAWTS